MVSAKGSFLLVSFFLVGAPNSRPRAPPLASLQDRVIGAKIDNLTQAAPPLSARDARAVKRIRCFQWADDIVHGLLVLCP